MPDVGSTLPRRQLGRYLLDWRNRSGLSQDKAAKLLEIGSSSLARLELGQNVRMRIRDIKAAFELYGMPADLVEAMVGLAQQAAVKSWWHQYGDLIPKTFDIYMGLESAAIRITDYQPDLIPGLLQTPDYHRGIVKLRWPDESGEEWDRRVEIRMQRQHIVTRKTQPTGLDVVIGEAALRRIVESETIMRQQARYLAEMSTLDNITIRILPFTAGFPDGWSMQPFVILEFDVGPTGDPIEPPLVYLEGSVGGMYLEKEEDVLFYSQRYSSIRAAALSEVESRRLLRRIAQGA
jgi:transcriptional regulator with XRE-family HTH domain